jgi:YjbE family integral membrane protein
MPDLSLGAAFTGLVADMSMPKFWIGVLEIIWIDILLAGDNAVVIALACRKLPRNLRVWGMALGAGVAILMRILFTLVVAMLMTVPFLKIAGGVALFYIALKLLTPEEEQHGEDIEASTHLWRAVRVIAIADVVMSLDNVIAIAGASDGHVALFMFGLAASIPLIVAGARVVMVLLTRYPALVWAGSALLGWIAGQVIATDPVVKGFLLDNYGHDFARMVEFGCATAGALVVLAAGWRLRSGVSAPAEAEGTNR